MNYIKNLGQMLGLFIIVCLASACSELSDVGNQSDASPVASAAVIGAQSSEANSEKTHSVRSGTDVLLSGKDSDGVDDPILQFEWEQTDSSGYEVVLVERNRNSRVFTAPTVSAETQLQFQLTVTDADGVRVTDLVNITVVPVNDVNGFLVHPDSQSAVLTLLAAPDAGQMTGLTDESFDIEIESLVHWRNKDGDYDSLSLSTETISGTFPANYSATPNVTASDNPRMRFDLPAIEIDEINQHFESSDRQRRLELYEIESAFIEFRLTLVPRSTTVSFKVYAFDGDDLMVASDITGISISGDSAYRALNATLAASAITNIPADAVLMDTTTSQFESRVFVEELKHELEIENVQSGRNYYSLIDPTNQFVYLKDWLVYAGFTDEYGNDLDDPSIAHAIYVNNYDLGFGRDMWTRVAENGNVYSYVVNYPSLEAAVQGQGDFAVVVMEYSENPDPSGVNDKIVKFYAYVPDKVSGDYVRANTMNFDGRGEKALPGVCTTCHYQSPESVGRQFTDVSHADLQATFLPWDLDSFLYSSASNNEQVDPSYNQSNVESVSDYDASREAQEAQFKKLNEAALATYLDNPANPDDPGGPRRYDASIELLHCMYGDAAMEEAPGVLPSDTFDSNCVQPGWVGQEDLYHDVYARYCRACHTQFYNTASPESNFDSYADFVSPTKLSALKRYVFEEGRMPLARLTMDRFWVNFDGDTAASELLRAHLESIGETVGTSPGEPIAKITASGATITEDPTYPNQVNMLGQNLILDANDSLFVDDYLWSITSPDCASVPQIANAMDARITLALDSSVYFPCTFNASLTASNDAANHESIYAFRATRVPAAIDFSVDLDEAGYTPGDTQIAIDIDSMIANRGDDQLTVSVSDARVTNNNDGTVTFALTEPLQGISAAFSYTVSDADGSTSEAASVSVSVPAITPSLSNGTPTASSVALSWSMPVGLDADSYAVYQKTGLDSAYPIAPEVTYAGNVFAHMATGLDPNQQYDFKVVVALAGDEAESNEITISTESGKPSGLSVSSRSTTTIAISWSDGPGGTPDCYHVYANSVRVGNCVSNRTYTHTNLTPNQSYSYEVSSVFGSGESSLSDALNTQTRAQAPSISSVTNGTTSVTLNWRDSANANTPDYQVYLGTSTSNLPAYGSSTSSLSRVLSTSSYTDYYAQVCVIDLSGGEVCSGQTNFETYASTSDVGSLSFNQGGTAYSCPVCHGDHKARVQTRLNAGSTLTCFYDGDGTFTDCNTSMAFDQAVPASVERMLRSWMTNGLPD